MKRGYKSKKRGQKAKRKRSVTSPGRKEVVLNETARITTEPVAEIRRPATLAQALTEPAVALVKPQRKVTRVVRTRVRRAA